MERRLLRVTEACESLGISKSLLYELIASGEIAVVRIGRAVRVPTDALDTFVRAVRQEATDPAATGCGPH